MEELRGDEKQEAEWIGAYRVLGRLGAGGMGEVFLAYDDRLGRKVAIKRIRGDSADGQSRERLALEARSAAGLNHPSIVQVYDIVDVQDGIHIVMEYVPGIPLSRMSQEGPLDLDCVVRYGRDIVDGLAEAHSRGLIHRDLKPENVIVTPKGRAKLLDFGLAKDLLTGDSPAAGLTEAGMVVGTSRTMSPEQAGGSALDHRSDLFSLGVLLYEMVTGKSPFQGDNPLQTLSNVISVHPPSTSSIRKGIPQELSSLIDALMRKSPADRPRDAAEVSAQLRKIGDSLPSGGADGGIGDAPTEFRPASKAPPASRVGRAAAGRRRWPRIAAVVIPTTLAGLLVVAHLTIWLPHAVLRVAVLHPAIQGAEEDRTPLELASTAVEVNLLKALIDLAGIAAIDPTRAGDPSQPAGRLARAVAADEVLRTTIQSQGDLFSISMVRIRGSDEQVVNTVSFSAPGGWKNAVVLAGSVKSHLRELYADYETRGVTDEVDVDPRDYASFLRLKQRADRGEKPLEPLLQEIVDVLRSSPGMLEADLLAAEVSRSLFTQSRDRSHLREGLLYAQQAQSLASDWDPRPRYRRFELLLEDGQTDGARKAIQELERIRAEDVGLHLLRSQLAAREGRAQDAIAHMRAAVQLHPAWQNYYRLADLQFRNGMVDESRGNLEELLNRDPENRWGKSKLGELELLYGDVVRAEKVFLSLIESNPQWNHHNNIGLSRFLQGRYQEAIEAYRDALEIAPDNASVLLNLADAHAARKESNKAEDLYRRLLTHLEKVESEWNLNAQETMYKAQCLARLGRLNEAVEATQRALAKAPDDSEVLYLASLVYVLAGDQRSAIVNARQARSKGVQPRWFRLPAFDSLRDQPDFRSLSG